MPTSTSAPDWRVYGGEIPARADALAFAIARCCELSKQRATPATPEAWREAAPALKDRLARALGLSPLPKRTPLNARVVGRTEFDGYVVENVLFEARPGFPVPANLYLPTDVAFPTAAVVVVMGHAMKEGKNAPLYQSGQVALVRQGFVVLGYDPFGQGERAVPGMVHKLGYGSLLVGRSNEGMLVWETMRAVDYLCTRPEVDASRLGITGNSGGGENTFYTMPLEPRLKAGASCCFVCSYEEWIRHGGNHCVCNHLPGMAQQLEEFEIVSLNSPRPFLFCNGTKDPIFPIKGVRDTAARARSVYALEGISDRVASAEFPLPHGWAQPVREAAVGWLTYHLLGRGDGGPVPEAPFEPLPYDHPDLQCFEQGKYPSEAETLVTFNRKTAAELIARQPAAPKTKTTWEKRAVALRSSLWEVLGGEPPSYSTRLSKRDAFAWKDAEVTRAAFAPEPGLEVPALLFRSPSAPAGSTAVLYLHEKEKSTVADWAPLRSLLQAGTVVCALDPRGTGEVSQHENHLASDCIHLGRPLFGQQVWDVIQVARRLKKTPGISQVTCYGAGAHGLLALFAAALTPEISGVVAEGALASYAYALEEAQPQPLAIFVPDLLTVADVSQVVALCAPKPVRLVGAVGYGRKPLAVGQVKQELSLAREVYELLGAQLSVSTRMQPEAVATLLLGE